MEYRPQKVYDITRFKHVVNNTVRNRKINYLLNDTFIGKDIGEGKYWELWMLDYIKKYYKPGTHMLDIGANIGTSSLLMAEVVTPGFKVFSFEPVFNGLLMKNILDNNEGDTIVLYPYGANNKYDHIKIPTFNGNIKLNYGAVSLTINKIIDNDPIESIDIDMVPIDHFDFPHISLIKIDVEHMELEVLEGSIGLIEKYRPTILIEAYFLDISFKSKIMKRLFKFGYTMEPIKEGSSDFVMRIP